MKSRDAAELFNTTAFGSLVREARKSERAGFTNMKMFQKAIEERSGLYMTIDSLYKLEQGNQEPSARHLFALSLTLFGSPLSEEMKSLLQKCFCREWSDAVEEYQVRKIEEYFGVSREDLKTESGRRRAITKSVEKSDRLDEELFLYEKAQRIYDKKLEICDRRFESVALDENATDEEMQNALIEFERGLDRAFEEYKEAMKRTD